MTYKNYSFLKSINLRNWTFLKCRINRINKRQQVAVMSCLGLPTNQKRLRSSLCLPSRFMCRCLVTFMLPFRNLCKLPEKLVRTFNYFFVVLVSDLFAAATKHNRLHKKNCQQTTQKQNRMAMKCSQAAKGFCGKKQPQEKELNLLVLGTINLLFTSRMRLFMLQCFVQLTKLCLHPSMHEFRRN